MVTTIMPTTEQPTTITTTTSKADHIPEVGVLKTKKAALEGRQAGWEIALSIALLVTAVAAFLLFVFDWRVRKSSKAIQEVQDEIIRAKDSELQLSLKEKDTKIAEAGGRAAAAETKAEGFRLDIAKANERAAQAEERAAQTNLQLAKLRTPRTINAQQEERIARKLQLFPGIQCDIAVFNDPEVQALLPQLENTLKAGGWTQVHWLGGDMVLTRTGHPVVGLVSVNGVVVQMHPEHTKEFWAAAQALASALMAEGIEAIAQPGLGVTNTQPTAMHIMIGKKPQ